MTPLLITQLHFARQKWREGLDGVPEEDAMKRIMPMNSISWMVGHLAFHETNVWVRRAQGIAFAPEVDAYGFGHPASTPPLGEVVALWEAATTHADTYLNTVTEEMLGTYMMFEGRRSGETLGTMLTRNIFHYWYHLGEMQSVRQLLHHENLAGFVGSIPPAFRYPPNPDTD
jgi:hypothetical protein